MQLRADWLACREVCIPQSGEFSLTLPSRTPVVAHAAAFAAARASVPREWPGVTTVARVVDRALALEVRGLPSGMRGKPVQFFAEDAGVIEHAAVPQQRWQGDTLRLRVPLSPQRSASPTAMRAVIHARGEAAGIAVVFAVASWPARLGAAVTVALGAEGPDAPE